MKLHLPETRSTQKRKVWFAEILPSQSVPTVTRKLQALEKTHPVTGPLCALKNKTVLVVSPHLCAANTVIGQCNYINYPQI